MPPSTLNTLTRLNITFPMLFKLSNKINKKQTHCGVLEFVADEGKIYIPYMVGIDLYIFLTMTIFSTFSTNLNVNIVSTDDAKLITK